MTVDLMKLIHGKDIYEEMGVVLETDLQGWGGHHEFFSHMLELVKPQTVVEVGTWKGKSACAMGHSLDDIAYNIIREDGYQIWAEDTKIVCVDTFLGAAEMWTNHEDVKRFKSLNCHVGYPQLYYQFVSNVMNNGLMNRIVPFPQTSTNAARFFEKKGLQADLVYIDASHEFNDVWADLNAWYGVLSEGGVMFGDDYCEYWVGVKEAVNEFAQLTGLKLQTRQYQNPDGQAPSDYWVLSDEGVVLP